jgi:adenylate cyclase
MEDVISSAADPALASKAIDSFTNRIAFIADVSSGGKDYGPTAFESVYPLSGIHIEVIGSILNLNQGSFIYPNGGAYKFLTLVLLCAIIFLIPFCKTDVRFNIFFLVLFLVHAALVGVRWFFFHRTPWYTLPALLILSAWLAVFLFRFILRHYEQTLLKNALSRYVPKALAERILREKKTDLIPARKVVTILFSDIVSFTKWSADKDVQIVHDFLSEYHESMADIIFAHGGTVDKYIGDGMLAFFGDPFDLTDHPMHCVEAAVAMQKKCREIKAKWQPLVDINLEIRIGINTGEAIVGNLGTKNRIEYTVIGAAVNFAQRMESNAHAGAILLSQYTWEQVQSRFPSAQKRLISVKGYAEEVSAYELV